MQPEEQCSHGCMGHIQRRIPGPVCSDKNIRLEQCLTVLDNAMDTGMTVAGPVFVVLAISLFLTCMWAFYVAVFGEAFWDRCPNSVRVIHGTLAIWVCFNILFNYIMCVRTPPGSTVEVSTQDLLSVYPPPERWCQKCEKPKPALAHHCSVCKRCVLCMDHHCPWVNNCVGHKNYRYFFLFLFYLTFACAYAFPVLIRRYGYRLVPSIGPIKFQRPKTIQQVRAAHHFSALLALMLCMCVVLVVGGMLLWHVYLVLTAQGTIDVHSNRSAARTARAKGKTWKNVFDLGYKRNWQERFDCRGRFWWVDWLLPRLSPPKSNGYQHVIAKTSLEWASSAV